jgi:hypothetical protein
MAEKGIDRSDTYHIRVKGIAVRPFKEWFGDITIVTQDKDETVLAGHFIDQPALRGFLDQLWNLNFTILSVDRIENEYSQGSSSLPKPIS